MLPNYNNSICPQRFIYLFTFDINFYTFLSGKIIHDMIIFIRSQIYGVCFYRTEAPAGWSLPVLLCFPLCVINSTRLLRSAARNKLTPSVTISWWWFCLFRGNWSWFPPTENCFRDETESWASSRWFDRIIFIQGHLTGFLWGISTLTSFCKWKLLFELIQFFAEAKIQWID